MSGFEHNLHQRDAGAVEIDKTHGRRLVVQALARVLLQMQPFNPDRDLLGRGHIDDHLALADDRLLELRDLIALRQIRVKNNSCGQKSSEG